jgi:hypothetical protein
VWHFLKMIWKDSVWSKVNCGINFDPTTLIVYIQESIFRVLVFSCYHSYVINVRMAISNSKTD